MNMLTNDSLEVFNKEVALKFQLYNSLFTALPFHKVEKTGVFVSLFLIHCEEGYQKNHSPADIVRTFMEENTTFTNEQELLDLLFRFVQYSERQVVLFDALEDASFSRVNDLKGTGTLNQLHAQVMQDDHSGKLLDQLRSYAVRLVLTAHPTQFYPSEVLVIISDLAEALRQDNTALVNSYLQQLGKTPFLKSIKPTPYDEATNLIWYLENVFYNAAGKIMTFIHEKFPGAATIDNRLINLGFWPGGDRDGNPFVKAETALKVTTALRVAIIKAYHRDILLLKRRLTFKGIARSLDALEERLYRTMLLPLEKINLQAGEVEDYLQQIKDELIEHHGGLFVELVEEVIQKVRLFGLHFASLDIRQNSAIHGEILAEIARKTEVLPSDFNAMEERKKMDILFNLNAGLPELVLSSEVHSDTLETIRTIPAIQAANGEDGCHRYIISHSKTPSDIAEVFGLFLLSGWKKEALSMDIVPLFESIHDLMHADSIMRVLYEHPEYRAHLERRNNKQTIMLGFSDGTKDGGYLMANWSIYKAKEALTSLSREHGIEVAFFDGRGGPPARGGGRTHQFYASMGSNIERKEIQLTIQGQTISANFGTVDSARYNIEQLLHAGLWNGVFSDGEPTLNEKEDLLLGDLAAISYRAYRELREMPGFLEYLNYASPLRYYSETNIASRPSKRKPGKLNLEDLRAVPYVGSWSQLKQNLPGYYGVGVALEELDKAGRWPEIQALYQHSLFFKTLLDNCEMAMTKCFFPLTSYLSNHKKYGALWNIIHDEYNRTRSYVLRLSGAEDLMEGRPVNRMSVQMRQRIELPLLTIQQFALSRIRELEEIDPGHPDKKVFEKLAMRCSFGIINAERNSA
jgi:phosphoenolpyruvate carboxylase